MATPQRITPFLWFANEAEDAARFYTSIFKNSRIAAISRYSDAGKEVHGRPAGSVMTVAFELDGHPFTALNGGPMFQFTEAVSFQIQCENQEEIDYYWDRLSAGGDPTAQQCGWLKDRYGLSWQVTPRMEQFFAQDEKSPGAKRAMEAMLKMKKINIAELERAARGDGGAAGAGARSTAKV
ncbi:MAG TPA: VOC family protein [Gemmatimonadales bacterium]|nr:VOC family protein [Gemmatimonadales bacterium]